MAIYEFVCKNCWEICFSYTYIQKEKRICKRKACKGKLSYLPLQEREENRKSCFYCLHLFQCKQKKNSKCKDFQKWKPQTFKVVKAEEQEELSSLF